ncbi:DoxX family protein [Nevskia sp.]|uniref:HvfX family Cu-binding RiPP maturation protein n=1 Tax=Nevskia sp. TaxID=1929292 RepID=UPI003458E4E5
MMKALNRLQDLLDATRAVDWLAPLALRLYLAPVFWMAGTTKLASFSDTAEWFGNAEWGLGLPFPMLMAGLATGAEVVGALALLFGLGLRWLCVPLLITMVVAALTAHWDNGWLAISEAQGLFATERTAEAAERLAKAKEILMEHGNYDYLTEHGRLVVLNNGIEFSVTYFVMLLSLFFTGAGRYVSVDYWLAQRLRKPGANP